MSAAIFRRSAVTKHEIRAQEILACAFALIIFCIFTGSAIYAGLCFYRALAVFVSAIAAVLK